jgi:hypothetical protein
LLQKLVAFSQELGGFPFSAAGFEADQQPEGPLGLGVGLVCSQLAQQMVVEQAAEPVAAHRPLVHLAADHYPTAPGAYRRRALAGGEQVGLGAEKP